MKTIESHSKTTGYTYYALHWRCGHGARHANTGEDFVFVYGFDSKKERDEACDNFRACGYYPQAALEAVPASNSNVRRAIRGTNGYSDVMEWNA